MKTDMRQSMPCKKCGAKTSMLSTQFCDSCWGKDHHGVFDLEDTIALLEANAKKWGALCAYCQANGIGVAGSHFADALIEHLELIALHGTDHEE